MSTFLLGDDPYLHLARGKVRNAYHVHKFGRNPAPANGTEETIWDGSNLYPWATWNAGADNVYLKSDDVDDAGITVTIQGLDADYNLQNETVTLDATNPVTTAVASANTYIRLFRMYNSSSQAAEGDITAHYGSGAGTLLAKIATGLEQTQMSVYSVPAGHVGYLFALDVSVSANDSVEVYYYIRQPNGVFRLHHTGNTYGGQYHYDFKVPLVIPEKTDIDLRCIAGTGAAEVSGIFNLIIIKDNEFNEWSSGT